METETDYTALLKEKCRKAKSMPPIYNTTRSETTDGAVSWTSNVRCEIKGAPLLVVSGKPYPNKKAAENNAAMRVLERLDETKTTKQITVGPIKSGATWEIDEKSPVIIFVDVESVPLAEKEIWSNIVKPNAASDHLLQVVTMASKKYSYISLGGTHVPIASTRRDAAQVGIAMVIGQSVVHYEHRKIKPIMVILSKEPFADVIQDLLINAGYKAVSTQYVDHALSYIAMVKK
jgi:double-stranded RNA binding protein